jgi:rhamnogalacturonan endolyase
MKTKIIQTIRRLLFAVIIVQAGIAANAQNYDGYNYVETFDGALNGTILGSYLSVTEGYLRFYVNNQSGGRNSTYTFNQTIGFTQKLIVEFDWYPAAYTGGSGDEGQIVFRNGTGANNVLFALYNLRGSNTEIGIVAGSLNNGKAATVNPTYRSSLTNTTLSKWYHVKAEIYAGERICFTVTGESSYNRQVMLPLPSGFNLLSLNNVYFNATRTGNITWDTRIDNIGVKVADGAAVDAASVTIASEYDVIPATGSTGLSASVEPFDANSHAITWSVDNPSLATIAAAYPSWKASLTGTNNGGGDVTVTATSATAGVIGTKVIRVSADPILLTQITVSGPQEVSVGNTIPLSTTVAPGNASNKNVVWSSSDDETATVSAAGVVTGHKGGNVTITATAADGGGASGNHAITVTFIPVTSIELQGARRIFYTANPTSTTPFTLTSILQPTTASVKTLSWSSLDPAVATVTSSGQVSLAGGFGKTAIKAEATDGSGIAGYYYIEAAAENPYDVFSDFESGGAPFGTTPSLFQESRTLYFNQENQSGGRSASFVLNNEISGGAINLRFDWYAGQVRTSANSGVLSIQDNKIAGTKIISFQFADISNETKRISYFMGDYDPNALPETFGLENLTKLNCWYTLDVTLDFIDGNCTFTMTERDDPSKTQTVTGIPFSTISPPDPGIKSLFINGLRAASNNLWITSAIDNFGSKVVNPDLPTYNVTGLAIDGLDKVAPNAAILLYPRVSPLNARNKNVSWESLETAVATVTVDAENRVVVTGIAEGVATIRAVSDENPAIFAEKTITVTPSVLPLRQMERLDRGLVAVKTAGGVFLSWRLLGSDPADIQFNLYKNDDTNPVNASPFNPAYTDYSDASGNVNDTYQLAVLAGGAEIYRSEPVTVWNQQYLPIPVQKPTTGHLPNGTPYSDYTIYDGTVADLDGDGSYEIVFFWTPANLQDNSTTGITGNVFIDAYKLDGTKLWDDGKYIDLGSNIRAGAHYNVFLVYDFDGDGKAEIIVKTADGTTDTEGTRIGTDVIYADANGLILNGPEYLSVFEGSSGKLLGSALYEPPRGNVSDWGDGMGNRSDRFIAGIAYLDGIRPSAVMCRGYYTRTTLCAWDWDGTNLTKRWLFDSNDWGKKYEGQGNHNLSVADVDNDGCDEIIYGSLTIDNDGTPMYSTGLGHGDALHVGKLDPTRPGLQVMCVHENPFPYGLEMHDAMTGDLIWSILAGGDIGRGLTADIDPDYPGEESWSSGGLGTYSTNGTKLAGSLTSINMAVYWDGDTGRELFDGQSNPSVTKITASGGSSGNLRNYSSSTLITFSGASTNGGTKANPCLQADILGDWREEMILRASDNSELRIYTTVAPTSHNGAGAVPASGIPSLMHNKEYRMAIGWQNGGYNQPPHTDFFLGYNMSDVERSEGAAITVTLTPNGGTFDDGNLDEKEIHTVTGAYFRIPDITKDESLFLGWFLSDGSAYNPTSFYTTDLVLSAKWENTLFFNANGGAVNTDSKTVIYGEAVGTLPLPTRSGYPFAAWNTEQDGSGDTYTESTPYAANGNLTLYAQWSTYTVRFAAGSSNTIPPQIIPEGGKVTRPEDPTLFGYLFTGWVYGNTLWDFDTPVYADMTLSAQWVDVHRVTFTGESIGSIPMQTVINGETIIRPEDPVRPGYHFVGWFYNTELWDFSTPIYYSLTLTAQWAEVHTITFAGENIGFPIHIVINGETIVRPEDPVRPGYRFLGWFYNNILWDFNTPVFSSLTLTAQWEPITGIDTVDDAQLQIYPNPAQDFVTISGLRGGEIIRFFDLAGRQLLITEAVNEKEIIKISALVKGNYVVRISDDKNVRTFKLTINN